MKYIIRKTMPKHSEDWKAKRAELLPERMAHAKKKLGMAGIQFSCPDDLTIMFRHNCETVRFYPFTGWFTGKSVQDGRGLQNLLRPVVQ